MFSLRHNQFLQALLIVGIAWLAFQLSAILIVFFLAFLFTVVLYPVVRWLHKHHVPTPIAVLTPLVGLVAALGLLGYFVVPSLASQATQFIDKLPAYIAQLKQLLPFNINIESVQQFVRSHFQSLSDVLLAITATVATVIAGVVTVIIVMLYWLGTYDRIKQTSISYLPKRHQGRGKDIWFRVEQKLHHWLQAQILLSLVVGVMIWIGTLLIGLPFSAVLGLIAALLEVIPTIGPIVAAIPGILIGFTISIKTGLVTLGLYLLVQQIENHFLAPYLFGRTVRLHPVIIIFSLLVGATLYGIIGALLSVPVALVISAFVDSFRGDPIPGSKEDKAQDTKMAKAIR